MRFKTKQNVPLRFIRSAMFVDGRTPEGEDYGFLKTSYEPEMTMEDVEVATFLRKLRESKGLTLREAAECWECSVVAVSDLERARSGPASSYDLIIAIQLLEKK